MVDTNLSDIAEHLDFLTKLCLDLEAQTILELGTRTGHSTRAFLKAAKVLGAKVISVDIDDCTPFIEDKSNWEFHRKDDLSFDIDIPVDVLFIDTSHTYDQTLKELRKFSNNVRIGGVIILHDTVSCPDVFVAINKFLDDEANTYGIKRWRFENKENNNGLGVLWRLR